MPNKQEVTMSAFKMLESNFNFNKERIYEMHNLLRQIDCLRECPGINNDILKNVINDIHTYLEKWEKLHVYPGGIPVCDDKLKVWLEAESL